jgi:hypothetical protein
MMTSITQFMNVYNHSPLTLIRTLIKLSVLTGLNLFSFNVNPSYAETCTAFPLIGAEGTEVTKTVSQPGIPGPFGLKINNNWNTDFSVVPLKAYKRYIINFKSDSEGEFHIRGYLKYNDNTADNIYDQQQSFTTGETLQIKGTSRNDTIPYQINVFVGEPIAIGKTYTISVQGCI